MDDSYDTDTLVFREQADGRKVARLPSGKVALIELPSLAKVKDGERWLVRLDHHEMYAIARPLERIEVRAAVLEPRPMPRETLPLTMAGPQKPAPPTAAAKPVPAAPSPPPAAVSFAAPEPATKPSTVVQAGDRVAIFVDGANLDGACRDVGFFLDFAKLRRYLAATGHYYGGFYYVADFTAKDGMQTRFLDYLSHQSFIVRKKAVKVLKDEETGADYYKANVDTEIVVDMLNTADNYDVAFLLSGDADYERLVDVLRSRGKRIYAVSSRTHMSRELGYVADKPVFYLEDHRREIEREAVAAVPSANGAPPVPVVPPEIAARVR